MKRISQSPKRWQWALRALVILVVPGALWIWIAWCLLRAVHVRQGG